MQLSKLKLCGILVSCLFLLACSDSDDFTSDSSYQPKLGVEHIDFSIVLTELGSSTQQFKIYNPHNKSLTIESIRLKKADKSVFSLNIDGQKGYQIANIDLLKKDSIWGFVKVNPNQLDKEKVDLEDTIEFVTNGVSQEIVLRAIGQDVHVVKTMFISENTTFEADKPYLIYDSLIVEENTTLKLEKGCVFLMRNKAKLIINGKLDARASIEEPIIFRGDRFDDVDLNIPFDHVSGQWDGLYFGALSSDNHLENFQMRNSSHGMVFKYSETDRLKAKLINGILHNNSLSGLDAENCNLIATNCQFSNTSGAVLNLKGGSYNFTHCTIANYYRWTGRQKYSVIISNYTDNLDPVALQECNFYNSIIFGSLKDEIFLAQDGSGESFNYFFQNCLLKHQAVNEEKFKNVRWNEEPVFMNINSAGDYSYDFSLNQGSAAIGGADIEIAKLVPRDIFGYSRLLDQKADMGAYERHIQP